MGFGKTRTLALIPILTKMDLDTKLFVKEFTNASDVYSSFSLSLFFIF